MYTASFHDWTGAIGWDAPRMVSTYVVATQYGDIVKLVSKATTPSSNLAPLLGCHTAKPLIALNFGVSGQLSQVLNACLTPVTHPLLPNKAAPGQLSVAEIHRGQHLWLWEQVMYVCGR